VVFGSNVGLRFGWPARAPEESQVTEAVIQTTVIASGLARHNPYSQLIIKKHRAFPRSAAN